MDTGNTSLIKSSSGLAISQEMISMLSQIKLDDLSDADREKVTKNLLMQKMTTQLEAVVKKHQINIEELKQTWLNTLNSEITRKNYSHNLDVFIEWLGNNNIIEAKSLDADEYLVHLKNKYRSDGSIRFIIAAASSFVSFLVRHDILSHNYFHRIKLPARKIEIKSSLDVPTFDEIEAIENELRRGLTTHGRGSAGVIKGSKKLLIAVGIMKTTACRVGALSSLTIDSQGHYSARSKGGYVRGKVPDHIINMIEEMGFDKSAPLKGVKTASLKKYFEIICRRLYQSRKLRKIYAPHSLRHYAAITYWNATKDINLLKKFLNHQSISTSQIYLSSLNIEKYEGDRL